ncbi:unnamed protein product [Closterium sp. Naga37s-1]|nr:unnamed protein product [Closterium sp. Naga37s-1]
MACDVAASNVPLLRDHGGNTTRPPHAKAVLVGYGPFPWSFYVFRSWRQPVVNPGDVLVFKWGFWPHGVRKLASGTAYENCDFSGSSKCAFAPLLRRPSLDAPLPHALTSLSSCSPSHLLLHVEGSFSLPASFFPSLYCLFSLALPSRYMVRAADAATALFFTCALFPICIDLPALSLCTPSLPPPGTQCRQLMRQRRSSSRALCPATAGQAA